MMNSSQKTDWRDYPFSVLIDVSDEFIGDKLNRLFKRDPAVDGGVDMLRMNGQALSPDDPIPNVLAVGSEVTHLIEPGFSIHMADGEAAHDWSITARASEHCVRLRFAIKGDAQYRADNASVVDEDSSCTFIVQPAGASLTGVYRRGVTYRYCSVDLSRTFLVERLGISEAQLPAPVTSSWQRQEIAFGRIEPERSTLALLQRLFTLWSDDTWARIQAHGIGLLIIAQLFSAWRDQRRPSAVLVRLKSSEREALSRLHAQAEQRCPLPISIEEALSICGLNRNKIHYGFKEMYGMSLQRYCNDLRMQKAAELLRTSDLTIAQIADKTGFSEPTNFTAAFRQHFGELPSDLRKVH